MTLFLPLDVPRAVDAAGKGSAIPQRFEDAFWDDRWWLVLRDASRVQHIIDSIKLRPVPDKKGTRRELDDLLEKQFSREREHRRAEIIVENDSLPPYFNSILLLDPPGNEKTGKLILTAVAWSRVFIMGKKYEYKRPRPSQLDPRITPMLPLPRHPAYPSGHSTQLHLIALVIGEITRDKTIAEAFLGHADQVALNREFAGFHYHSDSVAGVDLAKALLPHFQKQFADEIEAARTEWH